MVSRLRFHLDEHISPKVAEALRRHGVDVTTTIGAGLRSASDTTQLDFCLREMRVLVTQDADFLRHSRNTTAHAGIVYCNSQRTVSELVRGLILVYEVLTVEDMQGRVEYL
jgi:predicted nuclease of predicted toxin-antitoxin system